MVSFVSTIRDLLELISPFEVDSILEKTSFPLVQAFILIGTYVLKTIPGVLFYIISGQWLRDYTLLPILTPEYTSSIIKQYPIIDLDVNGFGLSIFNIPHLQKNPFLSGLFNSFFLSFPNSLIYIIAFRRLFFFGKPSTVYTLSGYLIGQWLFIILCIFGIRTIIIPWVTSEPLPFLFGLALLWNLFYEFLNDNCLDSFRTNTLKSTWAIEGIGTIYKKYFLTSFLLAWCEQSLLVQYFANVNSLPLASILETPSGATFFYQVFYSVGLLIGLITFGFILLQFGYSITERLLYLPHGDTNAFIKFKRNFNKTLLFCGMFVCVNVPFYAADYLLTAPFGFISSDQTFAQQGSPFNTFNNSDRIDQTPHLAKVLPDKKSGRKSEKGETILGHASSGQTLDIDTSDFDRGRYLVLPSLTDHPWTRTRWGFEDFNKKGELWWKHQTLYLNGGPKREHNRKNWTARRFTEQFFPEHSEREESFQKLLGIRIEPRLKSRPEQIRVADKFSLSSGAVSMLQSNTKYNNSSNTKYPPEQLNTKVKSSPSASKTALPSKDFTELIYPQQKSRFQNRFLKREAVSTAKPNQQEEQGSSSGDNAFGFTKLNGYNDSYRTSAVNAFPLDFMTSSWLTRQQPNGLDQMRLSALPQTPIAELLCKKKYYTNPLYKFLLHMDIDFFIRRQPRQYRITGQQEFDLYQKREMLDAYSDTLRAYTQMPGYAMFDTLFTGPKSFTNKVYNQQFKGTLKLIGRRFALTINPTHPSIQNETGETNKLTSTDSPNLPRILKFDQPLYKTKKQDQNDFLHEELQKISDSDILSAEMKGYSIPRWQEKRSLKTGTSTDSTDLYSFSKLIRQDTPFYAGWNDSTRQFVLSSTLLPREVAGYVFLPPTSVKMQFVTDTLPQKPFESRFGKGNESTTVEWNDASSNTLENTETTRHIQFTSWPLSDSLITSPKSVSLYPFETMTDSPIDPIYKSTFLKKDFVVQKESSFNTLDHDTWTDDYESMFFHKIANRLKGFYTNESEISDEIENIGGNRKRKNANISTIRNMEVNGTDEEVGPIRTYPLRIPKEQLHLRTLPSTLRRTKQELLENARETTPLKIIRDHIRAEQVSSKNKNTELIHMLDAAQFSLTNTTTLPIVDTSSTSGSRRAPTWFTKIEKTSRKQLSTKKRKQLRFQALLHQFKEYEDPRVAQFVFDQQLRYLAPRHGGFIWPGNIQPRFLRKQETLPSQALPVQEDTALIETMEEKMMETVGRRD